MLDVEYKLISVSLRHSVVSGLSEVYYLIWDQQLFDHEEAFSVDFGDHYSRLAKDFHFPTGTYE